MFLVLLFCLSCWCPYNVAAITLLPAAFTVSLPSAIVFLFRYIFSSVTYLQTHFLSRGIFSSDTYLKTHFLLREISEEIHSLQSQLFTSKSIPHYFGAAIQYHVVLPMHPVIVRIMKKSLRNKSEMIQASVLASFMSNG